MSAITSTYQGASDAASATSKIELARTILKWTFGLVPIVAGADKFMHLLADWDKYLAPVVTDILPLSASTFMLIVGVIEIIAGILVLAKPRIGSLVVSLWLVGIVINLLILGSFLDVAVRDAVMAIAAYVLYLLCSAQRH